MEQTTKPPAIAWNDVGLHDVLSTNRYKKHHGNMIYRGLITEHAPRYNEGGVKPDSIKNEIVNRILGTIHGLGGRFLTVDAASRKVSENLDADTRMKVRRALTKEKRKKSYVKFKNARTSVALCNSISASTRTTTTTASISTIPHCHDSLLKDKGNTTGATTASTVEPPTQEPATLAYAAEPPGENTRQKLPAPTTSTKPPAALDWIQVGRHDVLPDKGSSYTKLHGNVFYHCLIAKHAPRYNNIAKEGSKKPDIVKDEIVDQILGTIHSLGGRFLAVDYQNREVSENPYAYTRMKVKRDLAKEKRKKSSVKCQNAKTSISTSSTTAATNTIPKCRDSLLQDGGGNNTRASTAAATVEPPKQQRPCSNNIVEDSRKESPVIVRPYDVLPGHQKHYGNAFYRSLVAKHGPRLNKGGVKRDIYKEETVARIVDTIHRLGGRFLASAIDLTHCEFCVQSHAAAKERVRQALISERWRTPLNIDLRGASPTPPLVDMTTSEPPSRLEPQQAQLERMTPSWLVQQGLEMVETENLQQPFPQSVASSTPDPGCWPPLTLSSNTPLAMFSKALLGDRLNIGGSSLQKSNVVQSMLWNDNGDDEHRGTVRIHDTAEPLRHGIAIFCER